MHIYETRVAGATEKSYKDNVRMLRQREQAIEQVVAGATSSRRGSLPMSPAEQEALDAQTHLEFRDLAPEQQAKLMNELAVMTNQIPEHLREKAKDIKAWKAKQAVKQ